MSENNKIPYRFIPIPRFFLERDHFKDALFLQFICFAFARTVIESGSMIFYKKPIFLEPFEFIYGRMRWSELLQQEEHTVRKYIRQLVDQQLVRKVASKSTSKYTVFAWEREHFLEFSSQQNDRKLAGRLTANPPQYKKQNIEIETTTGDKNKEQDVVVASSGMGHLNASVKKMLGTLSAAEQERIMHLFATNSKKQAITNPSGWVRKCIEEGWYHQQKQENEPLSASSVIEENKKLADLVSHKLSEISDIRMIIRRDFVEFQEGQLYYHEDRFFFRKCLQVMIKKAGYDLETAIVR